MNMNTITLFVLFFLSVMNSIWCQGETITVGFPINKLGFNKIYLATGYSEIEKPHFIEAVVGKDPQI